jgi:hypothetical protein
MKVAPTLEQEIRALEEKLLNPQVRRSRRELELLLADDFREFGSSGRAYGKRAAVDHLQVQAEQRFVMEDFQARLLAPGVVLANYRVARQPVQGGAPNYTLRSSIWRFEANRWQMTFHQGTPIHPEQRP